MQERPAVVGLTARRLARARAAGSAAPIALTLLGGFDLRIGDDTIDLPTTAQRLVALLALRGRTSRSRLAGTLWPETAEHRALASLRTGIWRVNQVSEHLVMCTNGTVELGRSVMVDIAQLVRGALSSLRDETAATTEGTNALLDWALLHGDAELLPDWEDEWLLADRERMRQIRLHALEALAGRLSAVGRYGLAMEAALAALRIDVLRESAHRVVIGIHLAEGNVAEACRAFDLCSLVLARDVGVKPSAATTHLLPQTTRARSSPHAQAAT